MLWPVQFWALPFPHPIISPERQRLQKATCLAVQGEGVDRPCVVGLARMPLGEDPVGKSQIQVPHELSQPHGWSRSPGQTCRPSTKILSGPSTRGSKPHPPRWELGASESLEGDPGHGGPPCPPAEDTPRQGRSRASHFSPDPATGQQAESAPGCYFVGLWP